MIKLLAILCLISSPQAFTDSLTLGGLSTHLASDNTTNNFHRVVKYERNKWSATYARNSFDQDIWMISKRVKSHSSNNLSFNIGLVYGYSQCYGPPIKNKRVFCPMIAPEYQWGGPVTPSIMLFGDAVVLLVKFEIGG